MGSNQLHDHELIQDSLRKNPRPAWIYLVVVALATALTWGSVNQIFDRQYKLQQGNPFLQVTNREFSLFLWQFPEYMRVNAPLSKTAYLPGFQYIDKIGIEPGQADDFISAPPEVIFVYHVWNSMVGESFSPRLIQAGEFLHFLDYSPEWHPNNWPKAPASYRFITERLNEKGVKEPITGLPEVVQRAFIGWKNFFMEGEVINRISPSYNEMGLFLEKFPCYKRNVWCNILSKRKPKYLQSLKLLDEKIPEDELSGFLKAAYYNYSIDN